MAPTRGAGGRVRMGLPEWVLFGSLGTRAAFSDSRLVKPGRLHPAQAQAPPFL
jgi:hypothetical protein